MTKREQIEQAIISASAFTGNDTEELLREVDKVYKKAKALDDVVNIKKNSKFNSLIWIKTNEVIKNYEERIGRNGV